MKTKAKATHKYIVDLWSMKHYHTKLNPRKNTTDASINPNKKEIYTYLSSKSIYITNSEIRSSFNLNDCILIFNLVLDKTIFKKDFSVNNTKFYSRLYIRNATFKDKVIFNKCLFECGLTFKGSLLKNNFNILNSEIVETDKVDKIDVDFSNTLFEKDLILKNIFNTWGRYAFKEAIIKGDAYFSNINNLSFLDLRLSNFEKQLFLELGSVGQYKYLTLALYQSDINHLLCDHVQIKNVKVKSESYSKTYIARFYGIKKPKTVSFIRKELNLKTIKRLGLKALFFGTHGRNYHMKDEKGLLREKLIIIQTIRDMLPIYIHEIRLLRKIFSELNIREADDVYFAKLMNAQLEFDRYCYEYKSFSKRFSYWLRRIVFKNVFGWGVHLQNVIYYSALVILFFALIFHNFLPNAVFATVDEVNGVISNELVRMINYSFWDKIFISFQGFFGILLPDFSIKIISAPLNILITLESVIGLIFVTVMVAVLSRKFMRM